MLADLLGYSGAGVLASPLDRIMCFCIQNELPPLTVLVVNSDTGSPGEGLLREDNENVERENVFNYNWYNIYCPTKEDFRIAWEEFHNERG